MDAIRLIRHPLPQIGGDGAFLRQGARSVEVFEGCVAGRQFFKSDSLLTAGDKRGAPEGLCLFEYLPHSSVCITRKPLTLVDLDLCITEECRRDEFQCFKVPAVPESGELALQGASRGILSVALPLTNESDNLCKRPVVRHDNPSTRFVSYQSEASTALVIDTWKTGHALGFEDLDGILGSDASSGEVELRKERRDGSLQCPADVVTNTIT